MHVSGTFILHRMRRRSLAFRTGSLLLLLLLIPGWSGLGAFADCLMTVNHDAASAHAALVAGSHAHAGHGSSSGDDVRATAESGHSAQHAGHAAEALASEPGSDPGGSSQPDCVFMVGCASMAPLASVPKLLQEHEAEGGARVSAVPPALRSTTFPVDTPPPRA